LARVKKSCKVPRRWRLDDGAESHPVSLGFSEWDVYACGSRPYTTDRHSYRPGGITLAIPTMSDPIEIQLDDILRQDFNAESAKIAWMDLQTLFASGKGIYVAHYLDLGD